MSINLLRKELAEKHPLPNTIPIELTEERIRLLGAMVFEDYMFAKPSNYLHLLADLHETLGRIDPMVSRNGYFNLVWHQESMESCMSSMGLSESSLTMVTKLLSRIDEDTPEEPPHPELADVLNKVWYRGVRAHDDFNLENLPTMGAKGRDGYGVFLTDSINQAYSYAGKEGYILTMEIAPDVLLRDYDDGGSKHHSVIRYDQQVTSLGDASAVMAKNVVDNGAFGDEVIREQATNLGFSSSTTKLKVVEVLAASEVAEKLTLVQDAFARKLTQTIAAGANGGGEKLETPRKSLKLKL